MTTILDFIRLFFTDGFLMEETVSDVKIRKQLSTILIPTKEKFSEFVVFLNRRDSLEINLTIGDSDAITFYSQNSEYDKFCKDVNSRIGIKEDDETIAVEILITKRTVDQRLSVYELETFINYLLSLEVSNLVSVLHKLYSPSFYILFETQSEIVSFKTKSIFFVSNEAQPIVIDLIKERAERNLSSKGTCHYNLVTQYSFLPDDFCLFESDNEKLKSLFDRLCVIFCVGYMFDITTVEKSTVDYKLNGYKAIKSKLEFIEIDTKDALEYFRIYEWCYTGGNTSDKIGLARNIISLHFKTPDKLELIGNVFQSILSGYKVYEKQNIKQYIEIRNKISDQLLDFNNRANKIIENFASGFQKSSLALFTFYSSTLIAKVLGKGDFVNYFTFEVTIISFAFLIMVFIYFLVSRWEVIQQRKRFEESYSSLKMRNSDLLNEDDIKKILNNDSEFNKDIKFINDKLSNYSRMWLAFLSILCLITIILSGMYYCNVITSSLLWKFLFVKVCNC